MGNRHTCEHVPTPGVSLRRRTCRRPTLAERDSSRTRLSPTIAATSRPKIVERSPLGANARPNVRPNLRPRRAGCRFGAELWAEVDQRWRNLAEAGQLSADQHVAKVGPISDKAHPNRTKFGQVRPKLAQLLVKFGRIRLPWRNFSTFGHLRRSPGSTSGNVWRATLPQLPHNCVLSKIPGL